MKVIQLTAGDVYKLFSIVTTREREREKWVFLIVCSRCEAIISLSGVFLFQFLWGVVMFDVLLEVVLTNDPVLFSLIQTSLSQLGTSIFCLYFLVDLLVFSPLH